MTMFLKFTMIVFELVVHGAVLQYSSYIVTSMMGKIEQCASMFNKMNLANIDICCAINGSTAAAWDDTRFTFFSISSIIIVTSSGVEQKELTLFRIDTHAMCNIYDVSWQFVRPIGSMIHI